MAAHREFSLKALRSADAMKRDFLPRPRGRVFGKGKAQAPYEFGVKVSDVTTNARAPGGQFVLHAN